MKEGWEIRKLGEICSFQRGLTYSKNDEVEYSDNAVLRSNNVDLETNKLDLSEIKYISEKIIIPEDKKIKNGSLLICMANGSKSHLGKVALIDIEDEFAFGGFMGLVVPDNNMVSSCYLYYSMITPMYKRFIKGLSDGANINNLKFSDLQKFNIPVPPLSEQQRIVSKLDSVFEKIDALKANAENNLKNAKDLFQQVLKKELESKEGWKIKKLKDVGVIQTGTTPSTQNKSNFGDFIPFIKPADVSYDGMGGLNYNNESLSEIGVKESRLIKSNSVLMVCIGATIGKTGFAIQDVTCNQQINAITPNEELDYKFCYYSMISPYFNNKILKLGSSHQATLPIINKSKWSNLYISFPSLSEQQRIVSILDSLSEKCKRLEENYRKTAAECDALKQAVLRKVISEK